MKGQSSETRLRGIAAAPGIALGPAYIYRVGHEEPPERKLDENESTSDECARLDSALSAVRQELLQLKRESPGSVGSALAKIFDAQVMLVDDPAILEETRAVITAKRLAAESAFAMVIGQAQAAIKKSRDQYLSEMADDIESVKMRVINHLMGISESDGANMQTPGIVLATTITPADIIGLQKKHVLGVATQTGGQTSHTALLAKSLGIPAVAGLGIDPRIVKPGTTVVVDGFSGTVIVDPSPDTIEFFQRKRTRTHSAWPKRLDALRELPAVTRDRHEVAIMANIDLAGETELARAAGAFGVGLFRTEYLFLQIGDYPSEARQRDLYHQAVQSLQGHPLVVRTFDIGSDKAAPDAAPEANPALGVRGIRVSLEKPSVLKAQLRALLAASARGPIWVMAPMIASVEEFAAVRALWEEAKSDLRRKHQKYDARAKLGLMIETPAAVLMAAELARTAQFFSIGTNDLVQYTTAVDRGNARLASMQHHWHPALWRQIAQVVQAGRRAKIPVGVCGEMAGDSGAALGLVGLGVDSLSFHPNSIPRIKELIRASTFQECKIAAKKTLGAATASELRSTLQGLLKKSQPSRGKR